MSTIELTASGPLKASLKSRLPQFILSAILCGGLLSAIALGLFGTPVGSASFSIVFIWIAWWAVLILGAVPLAGRAWCSVCPLPLAGEWLQRGAVLDPPNSAPHWLGLRWPRFLRGIWLQNAGFVLLAIFSPLLLTSPRVTAIVLAAMVLGAVGVSLIFQRRSFCRYLCPVGGFIGLYSQAAPLALRVKDRSVCAACSTKPCYNGSESGYGCPWDVFPAGLTRNTYCGLCLECLRACPADNITIKLRTPGEDLAHPVARLDESFKSFIMLGAVLTYSAVLLGPWGALKDAAFHVGTPAWFAYAAGFLALTGLILPGAFALALAGGEQKGAFRQTFARLSAALIPLGLAAWIAFSLTFVWSNASYVWEAISDPLALGWNLLGTASTTWQPVVSSWLAPAQTLLLGIGLLWSARVAQRTASTQNRSAGLVIAFCLIFTVIMLWLLL